MLRSERAEHVYAFFTESAEGEQEMNQGKDSLEAKMLGRTAQAYGQMWALLPGDQTPAYSFADGFGLGMDVKFFVGSTDIVADGVETDV